eukprot:5011824-Pleurochrysis_carterae.AAC.5
MPCYYIGIPAPTSSMPIASALYVEAGSPITHMKRLRSAMPASCSPRLADGDVHGGRQLDLFG